MSTSQPGPAWATAILLSVGSGVASIVVFFFFVGAWSSTDPSNIAALSHRTPLELVMAAAVVFLVTGGGVFLGILLLRKLERKR